MSTLQKEVSNWQQKVISGIFALLLMIAGWLYSGYNERQNQLAILVATQESRIAVLEVELRNLKEIELRAEATGVRTETKVDQALQLVGNTNIRLTNHR